MLIPEQIVKNAKKYFDTATKYKFMNDELLSFLGENFVKAPATTMKDLHNAFEGGLIDHLLKVTKYAVDLNKVILLPASQQSLESIIKVCLLHQIGKAHLYTPCTSQWHIEKQGKLYEFNEAVSMRVGERSAFYALNHGIKLTEEEFQAIINFDKDDSDKQSKYHNSILGDILKMANQLAIIEEKNTK